MIAQGLKEMRFLLSAALILSTAVPLAAVPRAAAAADLDYEYGSPPPPPRHLYEQRADLPPPVVYERPAVRDYGYGRPYAYREGYRPYARPYEDGYEDYAYHRPRRPAFAYGPY